MNVVHAVIPSRLAVNMVSETSNLLLDRAITSLAAQTRVPDHVFVGIDPGAMPKVPARFTASPWITFVEGKEAGQAHALQAATEASNADVLVYLEDDDQREPRAVEVALEVMRDSGAVMVTSNQREVDESGGFLRYNDFATPSGWTVRRNWVEKAGGWDTSYRWHVDNALLGRITKAIAKEYGEGGPKRCHLVEAGAMDTRDPRRMDWLHAVSRHSLIAQTSFREPLVTRCVHDRSGMAQIAKGGAAGAESAAEMVRLVAEFGRVPW